MFVAMFTGLCSLACKYVYLCTKRAPHADGLLELDEAIIGLLSPGYAFLKKDTIALHRALLV